MTMYDPDFNITMKPGPREFDWLRAGTAATDTMQALRTDLGNTATGWVRIRRRDERSFVVRVRRGQVSAEIPLESAPVASLALN